MSTWLLVIVTFLYAGCGIDLAVKHNWPMALIFAGYAIANVGLIIGISK